MSRKAESRELSVLTPPATPNVTSTRGIQLVSKEMKNKLVYNHIFWFVYIMFK